MNDRKKKSSALFMPSGCLTGDALMNLVSDALLGEELIMAQRHVEGCPLCSDSVDGLRMWLKKNHADASPGQAKHAKPDAETLKPGNGDQLAAERARTAAGWSHREFQARTETINERIRHKVRSRVRVSNPGIKRISYKPFVWMATAATIALFVGVFYIFWVQNLSDKRKLAEQAAQEAELAASHTGDSTTVYKPVMAMNRKSRHAVSRPFRAPVAEAFVDEETSQNQDELKATSEAVAIARDQQAQAALAVTGDQPAPAAVAVNEEVKPVVAGKAAEAVKSKVAGIVAYKTEMAKESDAVFTVVEEMPSFPGGETERNKFLSENIVYPQQAAENGIQGTVYVSFVVDTKGNVTDAKILRGIGGGCDEEALRVVKMMPKWVSGKQNGKRVRVLFNMPVYFRLQK